MPIRGLRESRAPRTSRLSLTIDCLDPAGADNADKQIRSSVLTAYLAYQFDRSWGLSIAVPSVPR